MCSRSRGLGGRLGREVFGFFRRQPFALGFGGDAPLTTNPDGPGHFLTVTIKGRFTDPMPGDEIGNGGGGRFGFHIRLAGVVGW